MQSVIEEAVNTIKKGGVILYPTDTIWGLGCDATNPIAIKKVYEIKQREESKALITLVSDKKMLYKYTNYIPNFNLTKKPTTIIYPNVVGLSKNLIPEDGSAAIRIPKDLFCIQPIKTFGKAIVSTSANISGKESPKQFLDISNHIKNNVDYIVNLRKNEKMEKPSSIIKLEENGKIKKLR